MKYKDFEGKIEDLISLKLSEIEEKENIKILHAVESGSRAWGFASPDSDYDVRFIYIRPIEYYLKLEKTKDFIEWELDDTLDINGWDLNKALRLFHKSNATLFEWANSPIVYLTTNEWKDIYNASKDYFSCKEAMYHYYGTAKGSFYEHLQEEYVKYKKYFYVLRPLLACEWIEKNGCPPPVLFDELKNSMNDKNIMDEIDKLLEKKVKMNEAQKDRKIDVINCFIEKRLLYYDEYIKEMKAERISEWENINQTFLKYLK